ncbi:GntR family transcriptional regulator [Anaerobranca californiensis DSM 14826]|jgi:GntR family transcriptional regulator|uniref:GntR family transcriptional regulator n=1 Tax=Anaerobranca californiensis DSM 14826 TaxID=1120989 RepID=A0A1M6R9N9_9FIRM|nr:GntR family transcriptional regulator [Anaerobranca californiensis]SHK29162.1 GntR family transcriptional regulator [Anaerobranca californiensis DSM 14826]
MKKVCHKSPIPLYYQLKEIIQEMIENEELRGGEPIPSENELCEYHGISRMTVNKAINSLVYEGLVYRLKGKGTFVCENKKMHEIKSLKGFTEEMEEKGYKVTTKILSFKIVKGTKSKIHHLKLKNAEKLIEIKRLRFLNEEPHSIETAWIPQKFCPDLTKDLLENNSLYWLFKNKYNFTLKYAKQAIEPILINSYESKLLGIDEKSLALLFRRTTMLDDDQVIEYTKAIYRTDKFKYELELKP